MDEEKEFLKYAAYHNISDFADLSIREVIALQFLCRYPEPIVRYLLFTEVKQFIEFSEEDNTDLKQECNDSSKKRFLDYIKNKKKIYPPSFYNNLDNLREMGLLKFSNKNSGKKPHIKATPFTNYIPKLLLKFLINNNILDSDQYRSDMFKKFRSIIGDAKFERVLSVWFSEYIVQPLVKEFNKYANEIHILSKNEPENTVEKIKSSQNIKAIPMLNKQIFTPDDAFDGVIIPVYKKNPKFFDMNRTAILKEVSRVCKSEGLIILITVSNIERTDNVFLNDLIDLYELALNNRIFSKEELENDMKEINLKDIQILYDQGLLIGIGKNP